MMEVFVRKGCGSNQCAERLHLRFADCIASSSVTLLTQQAFGDVLCSASCLRFLLDPRTWILQFVVTLLGRKTWPLSVCGTS